MRLTTTDHDRDSAGLLYVYPVVSRRAGGVSIGVNLNPNNACNWRCVYCQVPGLKFGKGPELDLPRLEAELEGLLAEASTDAWMERHVPEGARALRDVAISGNGEPTSSPQFAEAVEIVGAVLDRLALEPRPKVVLITNGSLVHTAAVRAGLERLAELPGEAWYKLDAATDAGQERVNTARAGADRAFANLATCARLCPTWIQTIAFEFDGVPTLGGDDAEVWIERVAEVSGTGVRLEGVLLYGLARDSHQPEAPRLTALPAAELEALAARIEAGTGLTVRASV